MTIGALVKVEMQGVEDLQRVLPLKLSRDRVVKFVAGSTHHLEDVLRGLLLTLEVDSIFLVHTVERLRNELHAAYDWIVDRYDRSNRARILTCTLGAPTANLLCPSLRSGLPPLACSFVVGVIVRADE